MKRIVAVILITLLVTPPASAGQGTGKPFTWKAVTRLEAGTEIMFTVTDGPPTKVELLFADDSTLVTLKPGNPKLPRRVERVLLMTGSHWPNILYRGGSNTTDRVRVSKDGVFDGDRKVADLVQTPRGDIRGIWEPAHSHLIRNIMIGAAAFLGVLIAYVSLHDWSGT